MAAMVVSQERIKEVLNKVPKKVCCPEQRRLQALTKICTTGSGSSWRLVLIACLHLVQMLIGGDWVDGANSFIYIGTCMRHIISKRTTSASVCGSSLRFVPLPRHVNTAHACVSSGKGASNKTLRTINPYDETLLAEVREITYS